MLLPGFYLLMQFMLSVVLIIVFITITSLWKISDESYQIFRQKIFMVNIGNNIYGNENR